MGANTVVTALLLSDGLLRTGCGGIGWSRWGASPPRVDAVLPQAETFPQLLVLSIFLGVSGALSTLPAGAWWRKEGVQGMG
jgi:hypothetical protein